MSYILINQSGSLTSKSDCVYGGATSVSSTSGSFPASINYYLWIDGFNATGRFPLYENQALSSSGTANQSLHFSGSYTSGVTGITLWGVQTASYNSTPYKYADINLSNGAVTYYNGKASGIVVGNYQNGSFSITITEPGPTSGTAQYTPTTLISQSGNNVSQTITVPAGQNWLVKSVNMINTSKYGYGGEIDMNGYPLSTYLSQDMNYSNGIMPMHFGAYPSGSAATNFNGTIDSTPWFPAILPSGTTVTFYAGSNIPIMGSNDITSSQGVWPTTVSYSLTAITI